MMDAKQTILIVDDVVDIREELAHILEEQGYQIEQAENGADALDIFSSKRIDLLLTDILMPIMDGIELATATKTLVPELKVILISGGGAQTESGREYDYLRTGKLLTKPDHVLKKPFQAEELVTMVDSLFA